MSVDGSRTVALSVERADRLDKALAESLPDLSRSRVAALIKDGCVRVGDRVVERPSHGVRPGETIAITLPPPVPDVAVPQDLPLRILYEDSAVVVVDKAAGMVVHPGAGHADGTLVNALLHHVGDLSGIGGVERPGIVHRLDRGTSGLLVVAKNDRAHRALSEQLADRTAGRRYLAIVHGVPTASAGTIRSHLGRDPRDRTRFCSVDDPESGRIAITHWRRMAAGRASALVLCKLQTGRTHQIRVHLTELGHPLVGDPTYRLAGSRIDADARALVDQLDGRPMLHAWRLSFVHPDSGERLSFVAPVPDDIRRIAKALALSEALAKAERSAAPETQGQVSSAR